MCQTTFRRRYSSGYSSGQAEAEIPPRHRRSIFRTALPRDLQFPSADGSPLLQTALTDLFPDYSCSRQRDLSFSAQFAESSSV
jgi:hypothetical protein